MSKQLGFAADGKEGETLKSRAINSIKRLKIMKFFMKHTPKIVRALRARGQPELGKSMERELKLVLNGTMNLEQTLSNHYEMIEPFFDDNDVVMKKMRESLEFNGHDVYFHEDDEPPEDVDVDMLTRGAEDDDYRTVAEAALMGNEDMLVKHSNLVQKMRLDIDEISRRESDMRMKLTLSIESDTESHDRIKKMLSAEKKLHEDMDTMRLHFEQSSNVSKQIIEEKEIVIKTLEDTKLSNENSINTLEENVGFLKTEVDECKAEIIKLKADLADSNGLRKSFEVSQPIL